MAALCLSTSVTVELCLPLTGNVAEKSAVPSSSSIPLEGRDTENFEAVGLSNEQAVVGSDQVRGLSSSQEALNEMFFNSTTTIKKDQILNCTNCVVNITYN